MIRAKQVPAIAVVLAAGAITVAAALPFALAVAGVGLSWLTGRGI